MGASREMTVAALAEPTVALAIFALALERGLHQPRPDRRAHHGRPRARRVSPGHLLAFAALFIVTLAETGRLPVDNPATHLELTMIHEAMVLEYSGRYLALHRVGGGAEAARSSSPCSATSSCPWGVARGPDAGGAPAGARELPAQARWSWRRPWPVFETRVAKLRLFRVPELLSVSFVLALLAVTVVVPLAVSRWTATFSQLSVLGSSLMLLFGLILLWRRGVPAYVNAFAWQSIVLAGVTAVVGVLRRATASCTGWPALLLRQGGRDPAAAPAHGAAVPQPSASWSRT